MNLQLIYGNGNPVVATVSPVEVHKTRRIR